ncbi:MAG: MSMEG_1061 family FMN-dependent PPOX-type flavoprotein [Pseudomonadota bacterium]|nr:MSMEG_1061 family FMN-dependent PPOX-type flavoprotein [Pseudomonadota bacterium]
MYELSEQVTSIEEIRGEIGEVLYTQDTKCIDHIDSLCRTWIEHSPFVIVSTVNKKGLIDVAPKGDPAGSWKVLDDKTIAIPDRPGNNRADTFQNILDNPRAGLMFIIPERREVVRVSGGASIVKDPDLLASMAVDTKPPALAIIVHVEEAMFHCGKAIVRSNLWKPDQWDSIKGLPTYGQALIEHGKLADQVDELDVALKKHERETLY